MRNKKPTTEQRLVLYKQSLWDIRNNKEQNICYAINHNRNPSTTPCCILYRKDYKELDLFFDAPRFAYFEHNRAGKDWFNLSRNDRKNIRIAVLLLCIAMAETDGKV